MKKIKKLKKKKKKMKIFLKIFLKICAGARAGAKIGRAGACAAHYDFCAMCVRVRAKRSAH